MSEQTTRVVDANRATLVLIGCTMGLFLNIATVFNGSLTAFIVPISTELGWSRAELSLGLSAAMLPLLVLLPWVGRLSDKVGPRRLILIGAPLFAVTLAMFAWIPPIYPLFLLCCVALGVVGTLTYNSLYYALLPRWWDRRLGLALGIASAGTGAGLVVMPIAAQTLISMFEWRGAYLVLAVISAAVVLPVGWLLLRDGAAPTPAASVKAGVGALDLLKSARFLRVAATYFLTGLAINGTIVHLMPLLTDRGMNADTAALLASSLGIGVLVARVVSGFILDYFDAGLLGAICFLLAAIGVGMLIVPLPTPLAFVAALLIGAALGAEGGILSYVTRRVFGAAGYGGAVSLMMSVFLLGVLLGPLVSGFSYDTWGNYQPALSLFVAASVLAALMHIGVTGAKLGSFRTAPGAGER